MKKAWLTLFALTVAGTIGTACTITTSDGDDDGGASSFGGSTSSGGSSSGGANASGGVSALGGASATTGGKAGTGGSGTGGMADKVVCDVGLNPTGTPAGACEFASEDNTPCHECLAKDPECCAAIKECYGQMPLNQCAWGGPDEGSEYACIENCIRAKVIQTGTHTEADEDACVANCTTPGCSAIGSATSVLVGCMLNNCEIECFSPD